ncbi:MAG TPA: TlpA disulfide reductase family protein [Candidatus Acidoferrum sp.]|jgi:thiol-disulfide isomerase/thioredoxin
MERSPNIKSVLLDLTTGFLALCLLIAIMALSDLGNDLRMVLIVTAFLYLFAGFLRGHSPSMNSWLSGLLVGVGGALAVIIASATRAAFTAHGAVALLVLASLPPAMCGAKTRQLYSSGSKRWALAQVLVVAGAVILVALMLAPSLAERMFTQPVDRPVPSFSISTLDSRVVNSSDLNGHIVVLTFWATWCAPCVAEMPSVQQAMTRYKDNPEVIFWAVDADWGGDTIQKARAFSLEKGWNIPIAFDAAGAAGALGVRYPPALLILDEAGHVRIVHAGYDASENLAASISRAIASLLHERSQVGVSATALGSGRQAKVLLFNGLRVDIFVLTT